MALGPDRYMPEPRLPIDDAARAQLLARKEEGQGSLGASCSGPSGESVRFEIGHGKEGPPIEGTVGRTGAICLDMQNSRSARYICARRVRAGRMSAQLMAIVAEGRSRRITCRQRIKHERCSADVTEARRLPDANCQTIHVVFAPKLRHDAPRRSLHESSAHCAMHLQRSCRRGSRAGADRR